ncbi:MAG: carbohydrate porin [Myxococcales bacterium]|nr:carbohydrate porin [Myxococcales bacterium]
MRTGMTMMQQGAFCGVVAAVFIAIGSHARADDLGDATDDITIEDPAKTTSDAPAEAPAKATSDDASSKSLIEEAPIIVNINRRYYKFYGDPNTVHGGIRERSYLTDNWVGDGLRDKLVDAGVYLDVGLTQWAGGNAHGGIDTGGEYSGSLDLWANLDTAKLSNGLWPGAEIFLHGEVAWGRNIQNPRGIQGRVGSAIPVGYDMTMPRATDTGEFYLSEYYLIQALSPEFSVWVGQLDGAGLIDPNQFANSEKHQFLNTALVDNPIVGPFAPYTAFVAAAIWTPTPEHQIIAAVMDNNGKVNETVADTYDTDATVFVGAYSFMPDFGGKPGRYMIVGAYTNKDFASYAIGDRLALIEEVIGLTPIQEKTDNYVSIITVDQYLYVKDKERQIGWGLFGRLGWAPKNRNAIDQFYSFGVGGRGMLIPGRDLDFWGVGWAGTHISSDLRKDLELLGSGNIDSFEHAIEAFYNIELLPSVHLTLDVQFVVNPVVAQIADAGGSVKDDGLAIVSGARLQIDF